MSEVSSGTRKGDLGYAASVIALAIGMVGAAALLYYLIDILLVLFLGIVVEAALQPGHVRLARWGVPKGLAILLIYLLFIASITLVVVFVGPIFFEQVTSFAASIPEQYTHFVRQLQTSPALLLQRMGNSLPTFSTLSQNITGLVPDFFDDLIAFMTSTVTFLTYFVVVLAIGFYWTMEVPRLERVVLSLLPVARRPQMLEIWHEIEFKLGAFVRGQGLTMLSIGVASAIGYFLIGLPNVLVLAVLAGLFEAVPLLGPILAAVLAALVAVPQGLTAVLLVIGFSTFLQQVESNVVLPRIMNHVVGISPLVGLFAILAFGTLYGVLGAFVAIPLTVVIQVLLERMVINPEPIPDAPTFAPQPLAALHTRIQTLQQQVRTRLRERETRLVSGPPTLDHVADTIDQRIEQAVDHVETIITAAQEEARSIKPETKETIVEELELATQQIEKAVQQVETIMPSSESDEQSSSPPLEPSVLEEVTQVAQQVEEAVQHVASVMAEVQDEEISSSAKNETQCDNKDEHSAKESRP